MPKSLFIAEKPSVARQFADALGEPMQRNNGYLESSSYVVTWCVGHLITMSYPEAYDPALKSWRLERLPFIPDTYKYEVISQVRDQFNVVKKQLTRKDVDTIYVCTDSGREGEYIYRLVEQEIGGSLLGKKRRRVWIDSQTEEEIRKGIREAKDLSAYDNLSASAYMRAREDYLMGINFSRLLTLVYGNEISRITGSKYTVVSVGRVMTCVLGMVVRREREIRNFKKTPFYRVTAAIDCKGSRVEAEWKAVEGSRYYGSNQLYKDNGFLQREDAQAMIDHLSAPWQPASAGDTGNPASGEGSTSSTGNTGNTANGAGSAGGGFEGKPGEEYPLNEQGIPMAKLVDKSKKKEKKNPPLLYNLAELQNACSRRLKISPAQTLQIVQELYEKKLVTYPRTDARVLSTAAAKEIHKNIQGLKDMGSLAPFVNEIMQKGSYKNLAKTRYVNDKQITDHYAIVPTGQGLRALSSVKGHGAQVYDMICRRFLSIFYPPAVYDKYSMEFQILEEHFFTGMKLLSDPGYMVVTGEHLRKKNGTAAGTGITEGNDEGDAGDGGSGLSVQQQQVLLDVLGKVRKGAAFDVLEYLIREGETSPPKRYNSGSLILAMENAGQLIEDEDLRAQIKGSGIGTSATRAEILQKLFKIHYLKLNQKTQIITPEFLGELVYETVNGSIAQLLNPELTASWEKGLTYVAEGEISPEDYMVKLKGFIERRTDKVRQNNNLNMIRHNYQIVRKYY